MQPIMLGRVKAKKISNTLDFKRNSRYPEHVQDLCSICST